jgi:hypothetical protein
MMNLKMSNLTRTTWAVLGSADSASFRTYVRGNGTAQCELLSTLAEPRDALLPVVDSFEAWEEGSRLGSW